MEAIISSAATITDEEPSTSWNVLVKNPTQVDHQTNNTLNADVPPAAHQMALRNLMQAIRKFFHIMAIPEETNTPCKWMYSILLVSNGNAEFILRPVRFNLAQMVGALDKIRSPPNKSSNTANAAAVATLEMVADHLQTMLKRTRKDTIVQAKVTHFMSGVVHTGVEDAAYRLDRALEVLKEARALLDFVYIPSSVPVEGSNSLINTSLATFSLTLRNWTNCSIIRLDNDEISFIGLIKSWLYEEEELEYPGEIIFRNGNETLTIYINLEKMYVENVLVKQTTMCSCHHTDIISRDTEPKCEITKQKLTSEHMDTALDLRGGAVRYVKKVENKGNRVFTIKKRIKTSSLSSDVFIQQPWRVTAMNPMLFLELDVQEDEALLVYAPYVLDGKLSRLPFGQQQHLLLIPSHSSSLLLRTVVTSEHVLPEKPEVEKSRDVPQAVKDSIYNVVDAMASEEYNPLDYVSTTHSLLDAALEESKSSEVLLMDDEDIGTSSDDIVFHRSHGRGQTVVEKRSARGQRGRGRPRKN
ncbi:hypothetical protein PROFUN_06743 [Planoprotostelium fungivorum]|uniref:Uncharacterized protein n=1 Tax=Planoprotostelium fungivorum TaxID=1890364 RepID=A0A2P6NLQ2_9EUKA|nr:hypothetical protein PROFUN_07544 [Planoprotostelium fungivorum]PRP85511.1 hypothetical protein PROFUN_06743 [Planoprotostelium fungivorum]